MIAFGSPCTEQCMKSLQDGKLVLLCVQNGSTKFNDEALQGVNEFKADEKYRQCDRNRHARSHRLGREHLFWVT